VLAILRGVNWHAVNEANKVEQATAIAPARRELRHRFIGELGTTERSDAVQVIATSFVVLLCVVGIALWGLPFYYDFMVEQFGWTRAQVTSGNALSKLIVGPAFGFLAGWIVDRFGPRRLMMAGVLMAGVALIGIGSISSLGMFYFFYFFNALGYVCGGPLPVQVLLSHRFERSRGKAMGLAYLGISVGGAAVPWISHGLVQQFGWQAALKIIGGSIFVLSFPLVYAVKEAPQNVQPQAYKPAVSSGHAFKTVAFFLLLVGSMCSIAAVSGTQQNLKLFFSLDRHYSQAAAAELMSLVLTFSIIGRLLIGWLSDRFLKKYVMLFTYLLVATAVPFLFLAQARLVTYAAAAAFGIDLGGDYMIIPLITAELFGTQTLGRLMGVLLTFGGIAEALSPWFVGRLRDSTGSYFASCIVLIVFAILGVVSVLALPRRRNEA
jgi:sugar phosphate permease